jgi:hypothetical protein
MAGAAFGGAPTLGALPMAAVRHGEAALGDESMREAAQQWGDELGAMAPQRGVPEGTDGSYI